jgi:hypothetical protein
MIVKKPLVQFGKYSLLLTITLLFFSCYNKYKYVNYLHADVCITDCNYDVALMCCGDTVFYGYNRDSLPKVVYRMYISKNKGKTIHKLLAKIEYLEIANKLIAHGDFIAFPASNAYVQEEQARTYEYMNFIGNVLTGNSVRKEARYFNINDWPKDDCPYPQTKYRTGKFVMGQPVGQWQTLCTGGLIMDIDEFDTLQPHKIISHSFNDSKIVYTEIKQTKNGSPLRDLKQKTSFEEPYIGDYIRIAETISYNLNGDTLYHHIYHFETPCGDETCKQYTIKEFEKSKLKNYSLYEAKFTEKTKKYVRMVTKYVRFDTLGNIVKNVNYAFPD